MLQIRSLQSIGYRWLDWLNPFYWWRHSRRIRIAGAIAEWLHNLAFFSATHFEHFDEDRFWHDYQRALKNHRAVGIDWYLEWLKGQFERHLSHNDPAPP